MSSGEAVGSVSGERSNGTMTQIEFYESTDGNISLEVRADQETVWLTRHQLATLFQRDVKTIGKHIATAQREELEGTAVVAKFATTAADGKTYRTEHYNLDMILAVGYRVKSAEGVNFRRWANSVLKKYLIEGAAINEHRLEQIGQIVQVLNRSHDQWAVGIADVLANYLPGLQLLRDYDEGYVTSPEGATPNWQLTLEEAREVIADVR